MTTTAQQIMHEGAECIEAQATLAQAAGLMAELDIGALPVLDAQDRLTGIVTDRDIVTKCVAASHDPGTMLVGDLVGSEMFKVDTDADVDEILRLMETHQVRRLPVLDDGHPVGMISEADIARNLPEYTVGHLVEAVCAPRALSV
ncbi:CBS domain-containing protein [Gordonia amicalis]|nr:CBS domain-containing protein [Gordonia amicalis]UOG20202.1 CBS domain-containing protein [Gordonia amicalis]